MQMTHELRRDQGVALSGHPIEPPSRDEVYERDRTRRLSCVRSIACDGRMA